MESMEKLKPSMLTLHDFHPKLSSFRDEVIRGLNRDQKEIPAKFFYDTRGLEIFGQICNLPEYYLTRTEIGILQDNCKEIGEQLGPQAMIIEFGSGSSRKIRLLLDCLEQPLIYMPIDISKESLFEDAEKMSADYPKLEIAAVCADYTQPLILPEPENTNFKKRIIFFPGSTIGNLDHEEARRLLQIAKQMLSAGDGMLIGVDLKKDINLLNAAYNDSQGVTADFNLNLLQRINRELGADFQIADFAHQAFYNEAYGRIEMHLISHREQVVNLAEQQFHFAKDETIHTENSYKYGIEEFHQLAASVGFQPARVWTDPNRLFSVHYLKS
jgi:dimethylhistidine N-methyltransferase